MPIFPKIDCWVTSISEQRYDRYGQPITGKRIQAKCQIVKLMEGSEKTSVRADTSASRGRAREIVSEARLLFLPRVKVAKGDKIEVSGIDLKVRSVSPRYRIRGTLDHYEVDAEAWA